jgi:hypothetical protein
MLAAAAQGRKIIRRVQRGLAVVVTEMMAALVLRLLQIRVVAVGEVAQETMGEQEVLAE